MNDSDQPSDISKVLMYYGAEDVPDGGWRSMLCCFHDERRPSARVNTDEGAFICNGCLMKGDAIALIMRKEAMDYPNARLRYEEIVGSPHRSVQQPTGGGRRRRPVSGSKRDYDKDGGLFSPGVRRRPNAGR